MRAAAPCTPKRLKALGVSAARTTYANESTEPLSHLLEWFNVDDYNSEPTIEVRIEAPEFTCLCPITKQPDYAGIIVIYRPRYRMVESKSLKLYLGSYRNVGMFHEKVALRIRDDLVARLDPMWMIVNARFAARGGISFNPIALHGITPATRVVADLEKERT